MPMTAGASRDALCRRSHGRGVLRPTRRRRRATHRDRARFFDADPVAERPSGSPMVTAPAMTAPPPTPATAPEVVTVPFDGRARALLLADGDVPVGRSLVPS